MSDLSLMIGQAQGLGFLLDGLRGVVIQQQKTLKQLEAQLKLIQSNLIDSRIIMARSSEMWFL